MKELPPEQVALIEGDEIESWQELRSELLDYLEKLPQTHLRAALLIDEITSIPQWHRAIKLLTDQGKFSGVLVLYTGSSTTSLREGGEFFPGRQGKHRQTNFEILPLPYRDLAGLISLEEYFFIGGFPWAITEYLRLRVLPDFVGEIYWSWLKGEFLKRGKSDVLLLKQPDSIWNYSRIALPFMK